MQRAAQFLFRLPRRFLIFLVRCYQLLFAPFLKALAGGGDCCRFEPSCSVYAIEALQTHGALRGSWLAAKRICRCHPWGGHGFDPVPPPENGKSRRTGIVADTSPTSAD